MTPIFPDRVDTENGIGAGAERPVR
jgi:hypothetical protein